MVSIGDKSAVVRLTVATLAGLVSGAAVWLGSGWLLTRAAAPPPSYLQDTSALLQIGAQAQLQSRNTADFEAGNIGAVERQGKTAWLLHLRSDNDDALPTSWRQWFYLRLDDLPVHTELTFTLTGAGQHNYYLPYYSYDNANWIQFKESAVHQLNPETLRFVGHFNRSTIWLARYIPYHYTRLWRYLARFQAHPAAHLVSLGKSAEGRGIPLLKISTSADSSALPQVVIHARTHPGEVGSSFLLEGMINFLLSDEPAARLLRDRVVFHIVPMLNVDGVVAGNNRVSPLGVNLEGKWYDFDLPSLALDEPRVPVEVSLFHAYLLRMLARGAVPAVALNLHASAGEPADRVFAFSHFGPLSRGYSAAEAQLFAKQMGFIKQLRDVQGPAWFNPPPLDGGRDFLSKQIPERWWWRHFQDRVMALTLESTYGLAADTGHWMKPDDMRRLGASLAVAIGRYLGLPSACRKLAEGPGKGLATCR